MKKKALFNLLLFVIFFLVLFSGNVLAQDAETSAISRQTAELAISNAEKDIQEMDSMNFSTIQQKDILILAKNLYDADSKLESAGSKYDFSGVISKTEEISEIKKTAFLVFDELKALEEKTDEISQDQNMGEAMDIFLKAKQEFNDGRYSQSLSLIEECYSKISELSAVSAKIFAVYEAGTRTIAGFVKRNFIILSTIAIILLVSYFAFKRKIMLFLFSKKKERLELEKSILNELIQKAQSDYFEKGTLSEGSYRIRIQKFGELIRDIERRLSLINVQIGETMHKQIKEKEEFEEKQKKTPSIKEQIRKEKNKLRVEKKGEGKFFGFMHALKLVKTKEEKRKIEELKKDRLEKKEVEKRNKEIEKKAQENAKLRELEKREAEKRKTEKVKEQVVMKRQEEPMLTKEQKERTEERKRREYNRIKEEKIKENEEQKKRMRRFRRKMIFNVLHAIGLAKTKEEKEKTEELKKERLARIEAEKRKREAEKRAKESRIREYNRRMREEEEQKKRAKESKIIEYKRRSQEEIRKKQEAERTRIESEKKNKESKIREYERKKAEKKKIKEEAKRRRARFRRRIIFNFMHALGLARTKEEKEKIEKARRDRLARIEAEKRKKEAEKKAKESRIKAEAEAKRRIESEKKNKEIAKQRLRELIIKKAKEAEIRKKKEEEIRIEEEKKRQEKAEQEKRRKKSDKKGRTLIFNFMHALGLAKTEEEKERIAIRRRLGMLRKRLEEKVKRDRINNNL